MAQPIKQTSTRIVSREAGGKVLRVRFTPDDDRPFDGGAALRSQDHPQTLSADELHALTGYRKAA